jgi:hypothetical protein
MILEPTKQGNKICDKLGYFCNVNDVVDLAGMIGFIGQANIRHVSIFWQERVEQTVAFEDRE